MSGEEQKPHEEFGALAGCFVEGDPEQRRRQLQVKRRALALSVSLQIATLAAVILLPFLGKAERIFPPSFVPIPPYRPIGDTIVRITHGPTPHGSVHHFSLSFPSPNAPPQPIQPIVDGPAEPIGPGFLPSGPGGPTCSIGCVDIAGRNSGPPPPPSSTPRRVVITHLEHAMLVRRVEPIYPHLAVQTRREGRVELHAIIGTDGTIQALQIVSGDVLFYQSAKDAVSQWRYKPTILNGQAVEVDTTITVIYTLAR